MNWSLIRGARGDPGNADAVAFTWRHLGRQSIAQRSWRCGLPGLLGSGCCRPIQVWPRQCGVGTGLHWYLTGLLGSSVNLLCIFCLRCGDSLFSTREQKLAFSFENSNVRNPDFLSPPSSDILIMKNLNHTEKWNPDFLMTSWRVQRNTLLASCSVETKW